MVFRYQKVLAALSFVPSSLLFEISRIIISINLILKKKGARIAILALDDEIKLR